MEKKIELFLVSGFLGSGKTTFLKNMLLQMSGRRVGVIVNEFGSIGIDGTVLQDGDLKMVEINNGSIFCACLKGGFVKTLVAFLEQPIDYLFVEASGLADPANMESFLDQMEPYLARKPHITREYNYRGGICVADAMHFLQFAEVFTPVKNQIINIIEMLFGENSSYGSYTSGFVSSLKDYLKRLNCTVHAELCDKNGNVLAQDSVKVLVTKSDKWYANILPNGTHITNKDSIETTIKFKDEDALIGLGVLFELLWKNLKTEEKDKNVNLILQEIRNSQSN